MFKQLFRLTVVTYVWKRYKAIIVSTVILFVFFWLVGQLHQDYLSYGNLNKDTQHIGLSFVIKWVAFIVGFIIYVFFNSWHAKRASQSSNLPQDSVSTAPLAGDTSNLGVKDNDPFDEIRKKDKLRSKADMVIEKK